MLQERVSDGAAFSGRNTCSEFRPQRFKPFSRQRTKTVLSATSNKKTAQKGKTAKSPAESQAVAQTVNEGSKLSAREVRRREKAEGRSTYRPESYKELVSDAVESISFALDDGCLRMEVDFPTLAGDSYKLGSDDYIDANVRLAISAATELIEQKGLRVHILVPDQGEFKRSFKLFKSVFETTEGLTMGNLRESRKGAIEGVFGYLAKKDTADIVPPGESAKKADLFIVTNASTVELVDIEKYIEVTAKTKPLIIWNMELDTLRSDLGLFGFPSKDVQYRFLSQFKPIFYIRQREYAKVMYKQSTGVYACLAERPNRYNLGEFKEELMERLGLNTEAKGSPLEFMRKGYRNSTWWEDDRDKEKFSEWRS